MRMRPFDAEDEQVVAVRRTRVRSLSSVEDDDVLVREEPLEVRVNGASIAVLMRTPGDDEDLVRGFLITERIVESVDDIASIRPCRVVTSPESEGNVVVARLRPEVSLDPSIYRRNTYVSSSCGICGKASVELATAVAPPLSAGPLVSLLTLADAIPALSAEQPLFERTGGLHGAAALDELGRVITAAEDIGRHNAVDKVVGALGRLKPEGTILAVSGRVSFEIVQKALAARIPIVVAVSAPSSLAVDLARESQMTLIGFARGQNLSVYSDPGRICFAGESSQENSQL